MTDSYQPHLLNYSLLTCDYHTYNLAGWAWLWAQNQALYLKHCNAAHDNLKEDLKTHTKIHNLNKLTQQTHTTKQNNRSKGTRLYKSEFNYSKKKIYIRRCGLITNNYLWTYFELQLLNNDSMVINVYFLLFQGIIQ